MDPKDFPVNREEHEAIKDLAARLVEMTREYGMSRDLPAAAATTALVLAASGTLACLDIPEDLFEEYISAFRMAYSDSQRQIAAAKKLGAIGFKPTFKSRSEARHYE